MKKTCHKDNRFRDTNVLIKRLIKQRKYKKCIAM